MQYLATSLLFLSSVGAVTAADALAPRQVDEAYIGSMCQPATSGGTKPPCASIEEIASACLSNGTSSLALDAHAQCMCRGSYFSDYDGCLECLEAHGARSERDSIKYRSIVAAVSSALCSGTPTASYQAIFSTVEDSAADPTTGGTVSSDRFPSQTVVSLYFTATGPQGPGAITGSATAATRSAETGTTDGSSPTTASRTTSSSTSRGTSSSATSGTSSGLGATPTAAVGVVLGAAVGAFAAVW